LLQVISLKSEDGARDEGTRLRTAFAEQLAHYDTSIQKADVAGLGTVWRVRFGPFATVSKARDTCSALKDLGQDCIVVQQ
ncbi:MAG: SPOR domain-containing protein, partial [Kiloniellales bacterium]|nr:SPOR domain-containing protein [Kiloniellales bacterium]